MIIGSWRQLEIGKQYPEKGNFSAITNENGDLQEQPFLVIEQVTYEDYYEYASVYDGSSPPATKEESVNAFFYRVSTD